MSSRQLLEFDFPAYKYTEDLINRLQRQEIDGVIFRGFMSADKAFTCASRLQENPDLMLNSPCPYGRIYARTLVGVGHQLDRYFEDAQVFKEQCDLLFASPDNFEICLQEILRQIGSGRDVKVPLGPFGQSYSPTTIRWVQPEGAIAPHCESLYFETKRPEFDHLHQLVEPTTRFSFFMPMALPQVGGELVLYDLDWEHSSSQSDHQTSVRGKKTPP